MYFSSKTHNKFNNENACDAGIKIAKIDQPLAKELEVEFEIGRTYYAITYADPNFTMPGIEPFVFIGKNAFMEIEGDPSDTWQFQDALSYSWEGPVWEANDKLRCDVRLFKEAELGESIVTLEQLTEVIDKAIRASKEHGYPKISTVKGTRITVKTEKYVQRQDTHGAFGSDPC